MAKTSTTPTGNAEPGFNLPYLAHAAGAIYVARWTTFHPRQLVHSISQTFEKERLHLHRSHFAMSTGYGRPNKLGSGLDEMRCYRENVGGLQWRRFKPGRECLRERILVGTFIDTERPDFMENYNNKVVARVRAKAKGKEKGRAA